MAHPPFEVRKTWRNHLGNQRIDPLRTYAPTTIDEVVEIARAAEAAGATVRAVGSGHSWSDAALTEGFLIRPEGLARLPAPEPDFLRPEWADRVLRRVESGARVRELNAYLDRNGLEIGRAHV
jgi:FAD/FMN-containing dehydrogenase